MEPARAPYVATGGGWMAGRRSWTARATIQHRPQLRPVLSSVVGTLVRHGLAEQTDRTPEAMQQLVTDLGMQVTPGARRIERSWTPTELGERVLGYYLEAGANSGG